MKIGIDVHAVGGQLTGNETYISNLVRTLGKVPGDEEYVLYYRSPAGAALACSPRQQARPLWPVCHHPIPRLLVGFARQLERDAVDLVHVQYVGPVTAPCPMVVTIHDLAFLHFPEAFHPSQRLWMQLLIPWIAHRAAHVLTVSQFSRQDLIARYGLAPDKVSVTLNGVAPHYRPVRDQALLESVRARYRLPETFVLAVGNIQPRKNLRRLIEAWSRARRAGRIDAALVIVGRATWRADESLRAAHATNLVDEIRFTGYVPDEDLPLLYNAAALFVYPSLFEGFGLPPLEALACGTPVIAGANTAIPEVVGDAGLLVDTSDIGVLQAALEQVLSDQALRARLRAAGPIRAREFTWERCAQRTVEIYRRVGAHEQSGEVRAGASRHWS